MTAAMNRHAELLSPAGDWECLRAAVANGADAVFFGLPRFNARMRADNFQESDLPRVVEYLHNHGVKAYVTLNVLIFTDELPDAVRELHLLAETGVDAVIIQDVGLAEIARRMFPALRVHASTQMTITSPEGVEFARRLGVRQVVLARELSLRELERFPPVLPLEVFVHGALCVAYSGQCLTSEALGQRSANRGECAQACRMPYEMVVDGSPVDLGDRKYLLSPQDLAAVREIPALLERGVVSFKIEGRLKSPEYVAAVTAVYRKALDAAIEGRAAVVGDEDWYQLEMTFSRGLYAGWLHGVNHQELVGARFGKKRGAFVGRVRRCGRDHVEIDPVEIAVRPGDGVVFDTGGDTETEQGGRVFEVRGARLFFETGRIDFRKIPEGARVWKTDDPKLNRTLRQSFQARSEPRGEGKIPLEVRMSGRAGEPLRVEAEGRVVESSRPLEVARTRPLTATVAEAQFSRLNDTPFSLAGLVFDVEGDVLVPLSELNRLRRELIHRLGQRSPVQPSARLEDILPERGLPESGALPKLVVLCRSDEQVEAAIASGVSEILMDYEDIRRYATAVADIRSRTTARVVLATPRIQKAGEEGFFKLIERASPDAVLVRNIGGLTFFADGRLPLIGDFSLNVANPVTARVFMEYGLERVTVSHDLNAGQVLALLHAAPARWFEITLHLHMPMFHMEHCAFAAFLSDGTDFTNCGRPCEKHRVHLRDRVGVEHPLRADVGCRNTLYHATPQSGASFLESFVDAGALVFRIELLEEDREAAERTIRLYADLLAGRSEPREVWSRLRAANRVGLTSGTYSAVG